MKINKSCPKCKSNQIELRNTSIHCQKCNLRFALNCPFCESNSITNTQEESITCKKCKKHISYQKIKYIIENNLKINIKDKCQFCNNPTIHPTHNPLASRCIFFPKCNGHASLFENETEALTFLDFETSGLEIEKNEIIEIGAIKINKDGTEEYFETLIQSKEKISDQITAITGITNEMLENGLPLESSLINLKQFIADTTIVAHNAEFDMLWYLSSLLKKNIKIPNNATICTLNWAKKNEESQCSLERLTKKYNISHNNAHRALSDTNATKDLYFIFENTYPDNKEKKNLTTYLETTKKILKPTME